MSSAPQIDPNREWAKFSEISTDLRTKWLRRWSSRAKGVSIDVLNHPAGQHGFDVGNDDDRTREVMRRTIEFLQEPLKP